MWDYGTHSYVTFDKHTGEIVTLEDIFNIDYICILRYWLRQDLINQNIFYDFILEDVPVGNMALAQNGLVFSYSPYELFSNRDFNIFVHYDNIWGMTKQKPPHFDERECQFHQAVITRNDTYNEHTKIYNSCEEAKQDLRKTAVSAPSHLPYLSILRYLALLSSRKRPFSRKSACRTALMQPFRYNRALPAEDNRLPSAGLSCTTFRPLTKMHKYT